MYKLDKHTIDNVRADLFRIIYDLANISQTKQDYSGNTPNVTRSLSEDCCQFFDDCLASENLDYNVKIGLISEQEASLIKPLYESFNTFLKKNMDTKGDNIAFLDTDEWKAVADSAKKAINGLKVRD